MFERLTYFHLQIGLGVMIDSSKATSVRHFHSLTEAASRCGFGLLGLRPQ